MLQCKASGTFMGETFSYELTVRLQWVMRTDSDWLSDRLMKPSILKTGVKVDDKKPNQNCLDYLDFFLTITMNSGPSGNVKSHFSVLLNYEWKTFNTLLCFSKNRRKRNMPSSPHLFIYLFIFITMIIQQPQCKWNEWPSWSPKHLGNNIEKLN